VMFDIELKLNRLALAMLKNLCNLFRCVCHKIKLAA
jgi:hypothetical protein